MRSPARNVATLRYPVGAGSRYTSRQSSGRARTQYSGMPWPA